MYLSETCLWCNCEIKNKYSFEEIKKSWKMNRVFDRCSWWAIGSVSTVLREVVVLFLKCVFQFKMKKKRTNENIHTTIQFSKPGKRFSSTHGSLIGVGWFLVKWKQCRFVNVWITFCLTVDLFVKDPGRISCNRKPKECVVTRVLDHLVSVPLSAPQQ